MKINTPEQIRLPNAVGIKDAGMQSFSGQLMLLLQETFRAIYRDIVNASVTRADALPTAGADYFGRFFLISHVGALDTLHICVYTDATQTYLWKQVTLV